MIKLQHDVNIIFIMLGQQCNLSCKYCLQHDLITSILPSKNIRKEIITFIRCQAQQQSTPIDIRFYGGEPLIYFNSIKYIVNKLKDVNVTFSIISNGKLLTKEIVDFFNNNKFTNVAISWDGPNSIKTRKYDVFKEKLDLLLQIDNLGISSVYSAYNYPYDFIQSLLPLEEKYHKIHGKTFNFYGEEIMDSCANFTDLIDFDFNKISNQINIIVNKIKTSLKEINAGTLTIENSLYHSLFTIYCQSIYSHLNNYDKSFCSNGIKVINLDLEGNLYQCHNNWINIGNIFTSNNYEDYLKKAKQLDNITAQNLSTLCKNCEVLPLCKCGCPLVSQDIRQKTKFCELRQVMYKPIINLINEALLNKGNF